MSEAGKGLIDANWILRYLLRDDEALYLNEPFSTERLYIHKYEKGVLQKGRIFHNWSVQDAEEKGHGYFLP